MELEPIDYKDKYIRLLADMDNLRKHTAEQVATASNVANEKLIKDLLPFLDSLDNSIPALKHDGEVLRKEIHNILSKVGLEEIYVAPESSLFNDKYMNAIMIIPTHKITLNHVVSTVMRKGYKINDTVIRYTEVAVYHYTPFNCNV